LVYIYERNINLLDSFTFITTLIEKYLRSEIEIETIGCIILIFISKLCDRLAKLHEYNILHLDIKLENILIHVDPEHRIVDVQFIDFGASINVSDNEKMADMTEYITKYKALIKKLDDMNKETFQSISSNARDPTIRGTPNYNLHNGKVILSKIHDYYQVLLMTLYILGGIIYDGNVIKPALPPFMYDIHNIVNDINFICQDYDGTEIEGVITHKYNELYTLAHDNLPDFCKL
jgi:serine/threonine protein kinase